jgi:hypothetical protein
MSGVCGASRIKSREDFQQFLHSYYKVISKFPGFISMQPSGSFNSDLSKTSWGDIDLILTIKSKNDKATVKQQLQDFFIALPETVIVPFSSQKHKGKRTYNSGEIVSIRYNDVKLGYSVQIDNIIALDKIEATFKRQFLDFAAEKQGLILGLVKVAAIENNPYLLFKKLGINVNNKLLNNQEYEFNLSSSGLQLRIVTYAPNSYKQISRTVEWESKNFNAVTKLLFQYDLTNNFDNLLAQCKATIKNPRSSRRIIGIFNSMITVKSGEVGTLKGENKIAALNKLKQTLSENIIYLSLFKSLINY